jgi:integrase
MSVYKRGQTYWYKFLFQGQLIRESAKTNSKTVAREAERARRRDLELGFNRITKRERLPLFALAAKEWLASKSALTPLGRVYYEQYSRKLAREFGERLVSDITLNDIAALQRKRVGEGLSARSVNCEVATLRQVLKHYGLWASIAGRVRFMRERTDAGRALSVDEEARLIDAIGRSPSPALYPFFIISLDAGLRPSETRSLRRRDLALRWDSGIIVEGEVVVARSKTEGGTGRIVPLTRRARAALSDWFSRFPDAGSDSYVFPAHRIGLAGNSRKVWVWDVDLNSPMSQSSYKHAFESARRAANVECRFYDARQTFVTRLAENAAVSVETIRQLAGHVSDRMLGRYAHIRVQTRRDAIATLERGSETEPTRIQGGRAQNWAQSSGAGRAVSNRNSEKPLYLQDFGLVGAAGFEPATTRTPSENGEES